jgi:tetratricopeptide (TPR) repeat protein
MEILNKKFFITLVFFVTTFCLFSQSEISLREAFKKSYDAEYQLKYQKAIDELTEVYDASSYELNLRLGWLNYKNNRWAESVTYYKKAIAKMPMSIEAKLGIVNALAGLDKWDEIIAMYRSILKIDPYHAIANYRLALIYYNRSDFGNSWKHLKNYINVYPFDFDGNSLAGWIKYSVGKKEEAIVFFRKALLVNPYDTSFNKVLGTNK